MSAAVVVEHRAAAGSRAVAPRADPVTTEVVRHGLQSAAGQTKRALTARSPPTGRSGTLFHRVAPAPSFIGGHGEAADRDVAAVLADLREGYVTFAGARRDGPHALRASHR